MCGLLIRHLILAGCLTHPGTHPAGLGLGSRWCWYGKDAIGLAEMRNTRTVWWREATLGAYIGMNIVERGKAFLVSLRELAGRSAWDWKQCPYCGSRVTIKNSSYERCPWGSEG